VNEVSSEKQKLLIIMAMRGEAEPIACRLGMDWAQITTPFSPLSTLWLQDAYKNAEMAIAVNGIDHKTGMDMIGTQAATVTALTSIRWFKPTHILNFGTCGALKSRGANIGDLFLVCDRVWFHTRRIPVPGWDTYGLGGYPAAGNPSLAAKLNLKPGILSTTDSLDFPSVDAKVFKEVNADVADMEGAAIAWLSQMFGLPFFSIKGVTDLMDENVVVGEQFQRNFDDVVQRIAFAAQTLIDELT
jgi:5'-methylthioadenosine nucleosidase